MMKKQLSLICAVAFAAAAMFQANGTGIKKRLSQPNPATLQQDRPMAAPAHTATAAPFRVSPAAAEGPTLFGWMSHFEGWNKNDATRYGIYSFPATAGTRFDKVLSTCNATTATNADGRLCGYYVLNYGGAISIRYFMFEPLSGEQKVAATFGTQNTADVYTQYAYALAYNHTDATLYGEFFRKKNDDLAVCISSVDPLTGKATEVVELKSNGILFLALAFDGDGTLYGIGDDGGLYTLSLTDGACTLVGNTGLTPAEPQSAWFNPADGKLYWSYMSSTLSSALYSVNPADGTATLVSDYPATAWIVGLYGDHTPAPKAPANVTDLSVAWSAQASLDGTVTFTAPSRTQGGEAITSDLAVELCVDYKPVASAPATVAPGATYTYPVSFAAGSHTVEVLLKNNSGYNDRARLLTYAGTDRPGAVGNLSLTLDGRNATLTWDAPSTGMNGGWFDPAGLTYKIVRRPDNTVVANAHNSTTFTDVIPDCLGNWFYEVTPVTTQEGKPAASNRVMYGTAMTVPYRETFDTDAPLDLFTIEDANNDGYYWKWKNGAMTDIRGDEEYAADWLITPPVALTTDWIYKLTCDVHTFSTYYTETVNIGIGTKPEARAMNVIGTHRFNNDSWTTLETIVEIDRDGNYHLGIQHASPAPSVSFNDLFLDNLCIEPFISTAAPASAGNPAVTLLPDNNFKGTLTFTVPETSISGQKLTAVSKVEIYRGSELIATEASVTPGQSISLEVDVPQGNNTFNIIAYNDKGRGHDSLVEAFGGVDIPGKVKNLRYVWNPTDDTKATIMWDAPDPIGINGYPIEPSGITYNVLQSMFGSLIPITGGSNIKATSMEVTSYDSNQTLLERGVQASTKGGNGIAQMVYVNLGKPVLTPAYESFAGGAPNYKTWSITRISGTASWAMFNSDEKVVTAQDNDNGLAGCILQGGESGEGRLISPAFDFSSTVPAYLHLNLFHIAGTHPGTTLTIEYTLDGNEFKEISRPVVIGAGNGWKEYVFPLAELAGNHKAMLGLRANLSQPTSRVFIDNLVIDNDPNSGIDTVGADTTLGIAFTPVAEGITVTGAAGLDFTAHTPDGRLAAATTLATGCETIQLPAGIYMVKAGQAVAKVIVR